MIQQVKVDIENYEPWGNHVLCELTKIEMIGTMHIPDTAQKFNRFMQVVKRGPTVTPNLKDGDFVIIGPTNASVQFEVNGVEYMQFPEHVIIGKQKVANGKSGKGSGKSSRAKKKESATG